MTSTADGTAAGDGQGRPPAPGPLAVEAALLADALRGLGGRPAPGRRVWETLAGVAAAATAAGASASPAPSARSGKPSAASAEPARRAGSPGEDGSPGDPAQACSCHDRPCTACPVCRLVAAFADERAEVARHLTAAGGSLAAALRVLVDAVAGAVADAGVGSADRPPPTASPPGAGREARQGPRSGEPTGPRTATAPRPRVQRIDIT
ncbi:hypothetical protein [Frankia sp. AgB32]|uniref:hypothetical protein n=1 Tax=Frankia sp. AgB32 TaxID=631119 RepID=UPI00200BB9F8|nr:hypothetical protein [Frankia sp. AgB32]MCK9894058.1 hypothetical protein [Frankia sp. AgB32]